MAYDIGPKIGIDGEAEFRRELNEIKTGIKTLGSEMKLTTLEFEDNADSMEALTAKSDVLLRTYQEQEKYLDKTKTALEEARKKYGENSTEVQKWQKAVYEAEAELKKTEKQLKETNEAMEAAAKVAEEDARANELAEKSIRSLKKSSENLQKTYTKQEKTLEKAEKALEKAKKKYGENSDEVEKWGKAVEAAEKQLQETKSEINATDKALDKLTNGTNNAKKGMGGLSSQAKKTSESLSDIAKVAAGNLVSAGISGAVGAVKDLAKTVWNLDEATEEYRVAQGKLTTAFNAAGMGADVAQKTYTEFYKILGDTDTAAEASALLAKLTDNVDDLSTWTDIAAGVMGTFGDSLPIEGLIEASNETAKTGEITGVLADALNWAGIAEADFQAKLDACSDESERNQLIMDTLSDTYSDATDIFYANNEELVRSRENQAKLDEATGRLGESISGLKNTLIEQFGPAIADAADWLADLTVDISEGLGPAMDEMGEIAKTCFDGIGGVWESTVKPAVDKVKGWFSDLAVAASAAKREATGFGTGSTGGSFGGTSAGTAAASTGKTYNNSTNTPAKTTTKVYLDSSEVGEIIRAAQRKNDVELW